MKKRNLTKYAGVYYRLKENRATGKEEKVYYVSYRLRTEDGGWQKVEETVHGPGMTPAKASHIRTRRQSGEELPNRERRAQAEAARRKRTWTVSILWEEYKTANPGLKSLASYESLYRLYVAPMFGNKKPKEISPFDIDRLKRQIKGKSTKTVASALELLRRIVNFGIKRGLCPGPGFPIQLPRVSNEKTEDLTPEQLSRLLSVLDAHIQSQTPSAKAAHMMRLALLTGMRRGEMFKLKWEDIDQHRNNITLRDAKSGRDEIIPMSSYTARLLEFIPKTDSPYVFPGKGGGQLTDVKRQINRIRVEAELPSDFRPLHGLRHVFATMLVSNGVSLDIVSRLLTHKGRTVTHRYAHIRDDALREAAELAGQLLEEPRLTDLRLAT
ncbi:MAG: site-specific integrase [Candidatus Paceibacterota bacterium]